MTSCVLPLHVLNMGNGRAKGWRELETYEEAAVRLLRVLDERVKKRAAGAQSPAQITDQPAVSLAKAEKEGPSWSDKGDRTLDGSAPITGAGGDCAGWSADGVECVGPVEPNEVLMRPSAPAAESNQYTFTVVRRERSNAQRGLK